MITEAFFRSIGEYISADIGHDVVHACEHHPSRILKELYAEVAEAAGAKLAGDQSLNDLNFLRMLVKTGGLSSGIKVIHIVRVIRDLMVSVNRTGWVSDLDLYFRRF